MRATNLLPSVRAEAGGRSAGHHKEQTSQAETVAGSAPAVGRDDLDLTLSVYFLFGTLIVFFLLGVFWIWQFAR